MNQSRVVVGPVDRALLESGCLQAAGVSEFFAMIEVADAWPDVLADPVSDPMELKDLVRDGRTSLGVRSEQSLEVVLRLWRTSPTFMVDLSIDARVTALALAELSRVNCPVRLLGFEFLLTYYSWKKAVSEYVSNKNVRELVFSLCRDMEGDPVDWLLSDGRGNEELRIQDLRDEIVSARVPVLLGLAATIERARWFRRTHLPEAAGLFFGLQAHPDEEGRYPPRMTLSELGLSSRTAPTRRTL